MTITDLWLMISPGWKDAGIIFLILTIIQVAPVKLNPWTWLKDFVLMPKKVLALEQKVGALEEADEENMAITARIRIIRFACDIRRGEEFDEESYGQTLLDIDRYKRYCRKHESFENGKAIAAIKKIEREYRKRREERSFLE